MNWTDFVVWRTITSAVWILIVLCVCGAEGCVIVFVMSERDEHERAKKLMKEQSSSRSRTQHSRVRELSCQFG